MAITAVIRQVLVGGAFGSPWLWSFEVVVAFFFCGWLYCVWDWRVREILGLGLAEDDMCGSRQSVVG
jgi:hypothetical protein